MAEIHALESYGVVPARTAEFRTQPHNLEAEQALLGAILVNNEAYHRVSDFLLPDHFFEPVHARIFEVCAQRIGRGQLADPVTLKALIEDDPAFKELGGARYLIGIASTKAFGLSFPWGTLIVNIAGSFLIGAFVELFALKADLPQEVRVFLTVGICGGFTTFSTFSLDAYVLIQRGEWLPASAYIAGSVLLSIAGLIAGLHLVRAAV